MGSWYNGARLSPSSAVNRGGERRPGFEAMYNVVRHSYSTSAMVSTYKKIRFEAVAKPKVVE